MDTTGVCDGVSLQGARMGSCPEMASCRVLNRVYGDWLHRCLRKFSREFPVFSPVFFVSLLARVRVLVPKLPNHGLFHGVFDRVSDSARIGAKTPGTLFPPLFTWFFTGFIGVFCGVFGFET
jgi:hypothetical protein